MNFSKVTARFLAVCFAAGLAAAATTSCDKKPDAAKPADNGAAAVKTEQKAGDDVSAAAVEQLQMKPMSEAEIAEVFAFLPDPVATVNGNPIAKKDVIAPLAAQGMPAELFKQIGEEQLRSAMTQEIQNMVKDQVLLDLAAKAGFKPSAEFVTKELTTEIAGLPAEERKELDAMLKAKGTTLDEYIKEIAVKPEVQKKAAISKFARSTYLEPAKKTVAEADVKAFYDKNADSMTKPEAVTVAHILVKLDDGADEKADKEAKAKIDDIYNQLVKDPAQFAKLANEKSDCPSGKADDGKLPAFAKDGTMIEGQGAMDKTFAEAAFTLEKAGQVTKPVRTPFGYHIIKLVEKTPAEVTPLDKVKDKITEYLAAEKAEAGITKAIDDAMKSANVKINEFAPAKPAPAPAADAVKPAAAPAAK